MKPRSNRLVIALFCLLLSACALAQDQPDTRYRLEGSAECDSVLAITTDARLDVALYDSSGTQIGGSNLFAGDVWDVRLPMGRTAYEMTVWLDPDSDDEHAAAMWSYDLRVDCPITPEPDKAVYRNLGDYLTQKGIDLTRITNDVIVTAIPLRTPLP